MSNKNKPFEDTIRNLQNELEFESSVWFGHIGIPQKVSGCWQVTIQTANKALAFTGQGPLLKEAVLMPLIKQG